MMYRNRMLVAQSDLHLGTEYVTKGDTFAATDADADYLIGQKKAVEQAADRVPKAPKASEKHPEAPVAVEPPESEPESREALLQQAEALGLKVDGRWSNQRLGAEISALKG